MTTPEEIKYCCAAAYGQDAVALVLGEPYHPGGLALTRRLADVLGLRRGQRVVDIASGPGATACALAVEYQLLLDVPLPYTARTLDDATLLSLTAADFEHLLATSLPIARRWLSSVAQRLAASQMRLLGLLGRTLTEQVAGLLLDEAVDSKVALPQRTLAAMLGAQRPSLNKILKELEREGPVGVRYAAIDILDPEGLAKRTG